MSVLPFATRSPHYDDMQAPFHAHQDEILSRRQTSGSNFPQSFPVRGFANLDAATSMQPPYRDKRSFMRAGAEPGINPRDNAVSAHFSHFQQACVIDVIDYSEDSASFQRLNNAQLVEMMTTTTSDSKPVGASDKQTPVRWINVGGFDWKVLSALALRYSMHSLALEDILHDQGHNQSKSDYYQSHLFIRVLFHTLAAQDSTPTGDSQVVDELGANSAYGFDIRDGTTKVPDVGSPGTNDAPDASILPSYAGTGRRRPFHNDDDEAQFRERLEHSPTLMSILRGKGNQEKAIRLRALTKGDRIEVHHEPMFIFLFHDGTVISIHPRPTLDRTSPISNRLHHPDSILRISEDASLLVESLLDLVVDRVLEVVDKYQERISNLEHDVLLHPSVSYIRTLHILSGDLIMHKRTLDPIRTMIYGLRKYDVDRCLAIEAALETRVNGVTRPKSLGPHIPRPHPSTSPGDAFAANKQTLPGILSTESSSTSGVGSIEHEGQIGGLGAYQLKQGHEGRVHGYLSYQAKVYLADVSDHMDFVLASLDMFGGVSENLVNYAFNMSSHDTNEVMRRLTLATIIFLPLTLLTGYFGMNFQRFDAISQNSDSLFWVISLPVLAVLIPFFMWRDILALFRYVKKRIAARNLVKAFRS